MEMDAGKRPGAWTDMTARMKALDARRIVGWRVSRTAHASFVLDALEQALHERRPARRGGLVHQSDRGSQYVGIRYTERLAEAGMEPSVDGSFTPNVCGHHWRKLQRLRNPTVKPVALVADAIKDCPRRKGIILDPFLGSGTTVIAAERTGRRAYGIEIDPAVSLGSLLPCRLHRRRGAAVVTARCCASTPEQAMSKLTDTRTRHLVRGLTAWGPRHRAVAEPKGRSRPKTRRQAD
jgi:DNA methylase/integrase-like protein